MRLFCTAVAICMISSAASAQSGLRSASLPNHTPTAPQPTQSVIRSPSMPDRGPTNPFVPEPTDVFFAPPNTYVPNPQPPGFPITFPFGTAFYGPPFGTAAQQPGGYLQLDVTPATTQVTVDGMFMGSVDDFRRLVPGRSLEAGPHRVELQAPGHQSVNFDVRIFPRETTTYRKELSAVETAAAAVTPSAVRAAPKTFYVIPGCYAGDKPPRPSMKLPRGCDPAKMREVPPVVRSQPGA